MGSGIRRDCYSKGLGLSESLEVASLLHIVSIFSGSGALVCLGLGWAGLGWMNWIIKTPADAHDAFPVGFVKSADDRDAVHVKICLRS